MRKSSIVILGVMLFLITGMAAKFLIPSDNRTQEQKAKLQNAVVKIESPDPVPVPEPKISDIYVYITGEVNKPGVYKFSSDARIFQAIESAGGFTDKADQASINLAEHMIDGLQLDILAKGARKNQIPRRTQNPVTVIRQQQQKNSNSNGQVDINNADVQELTRLKGVGPAIAKRIIEHRNSHGRFTAPDDLLKVRGIGEKTLEKMRSQILIR